MIWVVRFFYLLSALTQLGAVWLVISTGRTAQRALHPARCVISGGGASEESDEKDALTVLEDVVRALTVRWWLPALLIGGIALGLAGNMLALHLP